MSVNKENYEAYYLDYLEGNLSESDCLEFENFLLSNPDLKVESDFFQIEPEFSVNKLSETIKSGLYQTDLDSSAINSFNVRDFLIADFDCLLSNDKSAELKKFLAVNKDYNNENHSIEKLKLIPDLNSVYAHKRNLKKAKIVYLKPLTLIASAAASIALFLLINTQNPGPGVDIAPAIRSSYSMIPENYAIKPNATNDFVISPSHPQFTADNSPSNTKIREFEETKIEITLASTDLNLITKHLSKGESDLSEPYTMVPKTVKLEPDYAYLSLNEMKNPIPPVTKKIADIIDNEVDFRTAKASDKKNGGFYIKIGKFEILHKK